MAKEHTEQKRIWMMDTWISLCAAIIALCALFLSIYEGYSIRKHSRLSVRPLVVLDSGINESGSGFRLENSGLGPAIVKWFSVEIDGKQIPHWKAFVEELKLPSGGGYHYMNPSNKSVILPGEKKQLFWVIGEKDVALRNTRRKITMKICYCSIYEECWEAYTSTIKNYKYEGDECEMPPKLEFLQSP
jgi:hypothetical protein